MNLAGAVSMSAFIGFLEDYRQREGFDPPPDPTLEFIQAYRVWLRPDITAHTVTLLYVELCPAEELDLA